MKTMKLLFTLALSVLFFASCSDDDKEDQLLDDLSGRYKVVSMKSSVSLDQNNDGIKSDDVLAEIAGYQSIVNYTSVVSYNKEKNEGHVSVPYPFQYVVDEDENTPLLYFYVTQFVRFSYKLDVDGEMEIVSVSDEYQFADYGGVSSVKKIDEDSFTVDVWVKLYDFVQKKRIDANVVIKCQRETSE